MPGVRPQIPYEHYVLLGLKSLELNCLAMRSGLGPVLFALYRFLHRTLAQDINNFHRECDGRFATKGNGKESPSTEYSGLEDVLGEEFSGLKGEAAIQKLMQERKGHVKGAFFRTDLGYIDVAWGDDSFGIQHILKNRKAKKEDTVRLMKELASVIEHGEVTLNDDYRYEIRHKGYVAIVTPEFRDRQICMVITAFKRKR